MVRKEGSGEAVTDAVVVLFNGDRRGAVPQVVNANTAQFRFERVPLKEGAVYSLQTKAPGLCGEEGFTSAAVNAQQTVTRDIVLKACHYSAQVQPVQQSQTPLEPGLTDVSKNLSGIIAPLNSIEAWLQVLAITLVLAIILLLAATLGFVIWIRQRLVAGENVVAHLFQWKNTIDPCVKKLEQDAERNRNVLNIPADFSKTVQQVVQALTRIASAITTAGERDHNYSKAATEPKLEPQQKTLANPIYESRAETAVQDPREWYRSLLRGEQTFPEPLFAEINGPKSDTSLMAANRRICFDERPNHGPFVLLRMGDGTGRIFPRPRSNFMPDHHKVFEELDQRNFEQQLSSITPREVTEHDGWWQLDL
jgi:hypothetical protein